MLLAKVFRLFGDVCAQSGAIFDVFTSIYQFTSSFALRNRPITNAAFVVIAVVIVVVVVFAGE